MKVVCICNGFWSAQDASGMNCTAVAAVKPKWDLLQPQGDVSAGSQKHRLSKVWEWNSQKRDTPPACACTLAHIQKGGHQRNSSACRWKEVVFCKGKDTERTDITSYSTVSAPRSFYPAPESPGHSLLRLKQQQQKKPILIGGKSGSCIWLDQTVAIGRFHCTQRCPCAFFPKFVALKANSINTLGGGKMQQVLPRDIRRITSTFLLHISRALTCVISLRKSGSWNSPL